MRLGGAAGLLMLLTAALAGCAAVSNALKNPEVSLERVLLRDVGVRGGELELQLGLENSNPFDLRGTEIALGFDVEGAHVGDVRYAEDFNLDQGRRTTLSLPLRFEWAGVGTALQAALTSGEIPYEMKGQLTIQAPWGAQSVPFTREGRVPLSRAGAQPAANSR
jgi:LEA14-like dessication related protein